jgi:uncharacterized UPF0160 family protein
METARLVTHSGSFHADDVFAYVILRKLFPQASLVRTRDPVVLSSTDERDIVFDVGFVFDPDRRRYDHHQAAKPLRDGDPEAPYSSVGLVWRYHGRDYLRALLPDAMDRDIARLWSSIERGFILPLDLGDNGKGGPGGALSLSLAIERFAPVWDDPEQDHDGRFLRAGFMADQHLRALVAYEASKLRAEASVVDAFSGAADPRVVVLEKALPWEGVVHDHGFHEALFVVFPSMEGNWMVRCVSPEPGSFAQRLPLPDAWSGLERAALAAITGIEDAVFCHAHRFVCAAETRESAVAMANLAAAHGIGTEPAASNRP